MNNTPAKLKEIAELRRSITPNNESNISEIERVLSVLVALLSNKSAEVQQAALSALSDIIRAATQRHSVETLCILGAASHVVDLLESGTLLTSDVAIILLSDLAKKKSSALIQGRAIHGLFQWMERYEKLLPHHENAKVAFDVLASLLLAHSNAKHLLDFAEAPDIMRLFKLLSIETLQHPIAEILYNLLNVHSRFKSMVFDCFWHEKNEAIRRQLAKDPKKQLVTFLQSMLELDIYGFIKARHNRAVPRVRIEEWFRLYHPMHFTGDPILLGQGGFGAVYERSFSRNPTKQVAVKQLDLSVNEAKAVSNFAREVAIHRFLVHPNIITFLGIYVDPGHGYMVLEMAHQSLKEMIKLADQSNLPSWRERTKIALEIANALAYVHAFSWMHCDISAANILIMPDGVAKLADFGIARAGSDKEIVAGKLQYLAPEVLNLKVTGSGSGCTQASDVYSLAVLLAELSLFSFSWKKQCKTKGRHLTEVELRQLLQNNERPRVSDDAPFKEVIEGAWKSAPAERYKMAEILPKLQSLFADSSHATISVTAAEMVHSIIK